jgi:hypothetical protein
MLIKHLPKYRATFVLSDEPLKQVLQDDFCRFTFNRTFWIGVSFVHPHDQYNRKIGIKEASERVELKACKFLGAVSDEHRLIFEYETECVKNKTTLKIKFGLSIHEKCNSSHLEYVYIQQ